MAEKAIINTDIGGDFDDLLALVLAMNSPEIEIKGIVTTKEHIRDKAKFARKILDLAGNANIPVFYSSQLRHGKGRYISVYDYGFLSEDDLKKDDEEANISGKGIEFMIDSVHRNQGEMNIISLATNTNLAAAMKQDPSIIPKIKSVYMMGGVYHKNEFNIQKPEHNYMRDRASFDYVVNQKLWVYIVPRDITLDLFLKPEDIRQDTELQKTICRMGKKYLDYFNRDSFRLSDPITVGSFIFPGLFKGQKVRLVRCMTQNSGEAFYCEPGGESNITAFYDFDRPEFYKELKKRL